MEKSKLAALGERLRIGGERLRSGGVEMGRKVGDKMKEILHGQSQEAKMVDEATLDTLEEPNWGLNLRICSLLNTEEFNGQEVMRAIKRKIAGKNSASQRLSLDLLEACAMNCDKVFSEVASEKVLEEMVAMIDNTQTHPSNRQRAIHLIRAWGQSEDLRYLPVFHQTYMSLKDKSFTSQLDNGNTGTGSIGTNDFSSVLEGYPFPTIIQQNAETYDDYQGPLSAEEKREILSVARNSLEILSSMLNFQLPEEATKDELTQSMLDKCKDSQPVIQRILESVGEDEALLFEALNLHEELQQVLSKYAETKAASTPTSNKDSPPVHHVDPSMDKNEDEGQLQEERALVERESKDLYSTGANENVEGGP